MRTFVLALFCLFSNIGCGYSEQNDDLANDFPTLQTRLEKFYLMEKESEWSKTYDFHTKLYRSIIDRVQYVSAMRKDNEGWVLLGFEVKNYIKKGNKVILKINFIEKPPKEFFDRIGAPTNIKTFMNEESVVWVYENSEWYVYDAGIRNRFSMNTPIDK